MLKFYLHYSQERVLKIGQLAQVKGSALASLKHPVRGMVRRPSVEIMVDT